MENMRNTFSSLSCFVVSATKEISSGISSITSDSIDIKNILVIYLIFSFSPSYVTYISSKLTLKSNGTTFACFCFSEWETRVNCFWVCPTVSVSVWLPLVLSLALQTYKLTRHGHAHWRWALNEIVNRLLRFSKLLNENCEWKVQVKASHLIALTALCREWSESQSTNCGEKMHLQLKTRRNALCELPGVA